MRGRLPQIDGSRGRTLLTAAAVAATASLWTAVLALPVLRQPASRLYGVPGDCFGSLALLRRLSEALRTGADLPWGPELQPLVDLPAALIAGVWGCGVAWNLVLLTSFPLAALAGWLLARRLVSDEPIAAFVGLAFAFSPYHLAHAREHMDQAQVAWPALFAWSLLGLLEQPRRLRWWCRCAHIDVCDYGSGAGIYLCLGC